MADGPPLGLRPEHWKIVRDILRQHVPGHAVWAFGSRARGTAKRYSDLDLAVVTDQPLPWRVMARLAEAFVESDLPWRVDVVDLADLPPHMRRVIEHEKVVVAEPEANQSKGATSARDHAIIRTVSTGPDC